MANHPNRSWKGKWDVDLEKRLATHEDGWVFQFVKAEEKGVWDGKLIIRPQNMTFDQIKNAQSIATQAGKAWNLAREKAKKSEW
ncbi:hypothetical protein [Otariodibacter oris]|uniref:Uncharacterized protein n=1 Tax=Otariodibacter oris TaxID=1032623 RepID=A0A420XIH5_9PAST|nr:hypothetical protein [Otariodibacter oris]QGM80680.1 hypothetical protein A6A10_04310 [Otariodibacter oris]RKR77157.1 hypothetical protein DES31_0482 [Otariodibacter oris]